MQSVSKLVVSLFLLAFAAFCGFGFLASFEYTGMRMLPWAISYGILGIASLGGALRLCMTRLASSNTSM